MQKGKHTVLTVLGIDRPLLPRTAKLDGTNSAVSRLHEPLPHCTKDHYSISISCIFIPTLPNNLSFSPFHILQNRLLRLIGSSFVLCPHSSPLLPRPLVKESFYWDNPHIQIPVQLRVSKLILSAQVVYGTQKQNTDTPQDLFVHALNASISALLAMSLPSGVKIRD